MNAEKNQSGLTRINNASAREMIERAVTVAERRRGANRFDNILLSLLDRNRERTAAR